MTFTDFCQMLQRRLPTPISAVHVANFAVVGLDDDPACLTWTCPLNLAALVEVETTLAVRLVALRQATIH